MSRRLALAALLMPALVAAGAARAAGQPASPPAGEEADRKAPQPGPFLAASVGGGHLGDSAPGLVDGRLGLRGHLELGYGDGRYLSGAFSLALGRAGYDNNVPPPESVAPEADLSLTRVGFGAVAEGRLPLGRITPILGAGAYLDRMKATASGFLLGIKGDYFEATDVAVGVEARAGVDFRIHDAVELGARAGWTWSRVDLDELTGGADWLSGPWVELRVTFDASGFRMASGSARTR
jgi:hypothetical protein